MNSGDFVYVDFVGRVKDTDEVFDSTNEELAKKEKIYNPKARYTPVPIIIGAGFVLEALDDTLKEMKVGEKKTIELPPEKAFGERRIDYIKLLPLSVFKQQNINPTPGNFVTIDRLQGKVISVDGGRVKVDFNHPLAGKNLKYEIEIKSEIKDLTEKIKSIIKYYTGIEAAEVEISVKEKEAEITFKKKIDLAVSTKQTIADTITKWINEINIIKFVDVFTK
jgi:FKBP-type peptidyl-prolyl cis-trans isomerase 2